MVEKNTKRKSQSILEFALIFGCILLGLIAVNFLDKARDGFSKAVDAAMWRIL